MDTIDGFPVLMREFKDGKPATEMLFRSVEKRQLDPGTFEVPAGYTAKTIGAGDGSPAKQR